MTNYPPFKPRPRKIDLPTYEELSREQDSIMRLPANGRYLVKGAPGTGKTVMTMLRANSLRKQNKQVLYILYYKLLRAYSWQLSNEPVEIHTYHSWICKHFKKTYGVTIPEKEKWEYDWKTVMDLCWEKEPVKDSDTYVIIDEGQDMPKGFYEYLGLHFENIFVSADENQRIGEANQRVTFKDLEDELSFDRIFELTINYRNSREIAEFCNSFYTGAGGDPATLPNRKGVKPFLIRHKSDKNDRLVNLICRRLHENPQQLVGLVPKTNESVKEWEMMIRKLGLTPRIYQGEQEQLQRIKFSEGGIIITNFHNIKGLEFDRLYIPDLREYQCPTLDETKMNLYVLCSRPKDILILFETIDRGADHIFSTINKDPALLTVKEY